MMRRTSVSVTGRNDDRERRRCCVRDDWRRNGCSVSSDVIDLSLEERGKAIGGVTRERQIQPVHRSAPASRVFFQAPLPTNVNCL